MVKTTKISDFSADLGRGLKYSFYIDYIRIRYPDDNDYLFVDQKVTFPRESHSFFGVV